MKTIKQVLFTLGSSWVLVFIVMCVVFVLSVLNIGGAWVWRCVAFILALTLTVVDASMFFGTPYEQASWAKNRAKMLIEDKEEKK